MLVTVDGEGLQESSEAQPPSRDMSFVPPDDMRASLVLCSGCCRFCCCCCCCWDEPGAVTDLASVGALGAAGCPDIQAALMEIACCRPAAVDVPHQHSYCCTTITGFLQTCPVANARNGREDIARCII